MSSKSMNLRNFLMLLLLGLVASVPAFAGSAVIGSVAGSKNATLGGQTLLPRTTIFSGDSLQVSNGVAVVAVGQTSRMVFGRETSASFLRDANDVTVLLSQGNVSMFHPDDKVGLRVKAGNVTVAPAKGFKTLGEVAMVGGTVLVTAKEGKLTVEGNGSAREVAQGKTLAIPMHAAAAPQGGGSQKLGGNADTILDVLALGAGGAAAILAGIGISRSNDAKDAANAATAAANQADADAKAATSAANQANSTAGLAVSTTVNLGCAFDAAIAPNAPPSASPFQPPTGYTCNTNTTFITRGR